MGGRAGLRFKEVLYRFPSRMTVSSAPTASTRTSNRFATASMDTATAFQPPTTALAAANEASLQPTHPLKRSPLGGWMGGLPSYRPDPAAKRFVLPVSPPHELRAVWQRANPCTDPGMMPAFRGGT